MSNTSEKQPQLSIIIVNYNGGQEILLCLKSLYEVRRELEFEVIVADNGSTDGSLETARQNYGEFTYLQSESNVGFAAACNAGLAKSRGKHAMLLNPDTEILPGALRSMVLAIESHQNWGIVGAKMLDTEGKPYRAARRFPTPFYLFSAATGLANLFANTKFFNGYLYGEKNTDSLDEVDQVEGSALLISQNARKKIGDLDARFFIFFEEVDWCKRVKDAGYEIHVVGEAKIKHRRSSTMSKYFVKTQEIHAESAMKFFLKHHGQDGLNSLRNWMTAALRFRHFIMSIAAICGIEKSKPRRDAAKAAREIYQRGIAL